MTANPQKTSIPRPPAWMDRAQKKLFRQLVDAKFGENGSVSATAAAEIVDYIEVRTRIALLRDMLADDANKDTEFASRRDRMLKTTAQIDSHLAMAHRLADRIGLDLIGGRKA